MSGPHLTRRELLRGAIVAAATTATMGVVPMRSAHSESPMAHRQPPSDPPETIALWPEGSPVLASRANGSAPLVESIVERSKDPLVKDRALHAVTRPRLVVFRPKVANGTSVLIMPGGGHKWVVIDKEGYELGHWLSERGFTVFVLFYRIPGDGWRDRANVPLADAQRAMRLVRARAKAEGLDPNRVMALGFSAGGHVCADLVARFAAPTYTAQDERDHLSARPTAAGLIYPVVSMSSPTAHAGSRLQLLGAQPSAAAERAHSPHLHIGADACPCFLLHAEDDTAVPVENTLLLRDALRAQKVSVQTHLFARGGHGFGLRLAAGKPVERWPELFVDWLRAQP